MAKIVVGSSYSNITELDAKEEKRLRDALSYVVGGSAAYFSGYGVRRKSLLTKRGEFPTGLLPRVKKLLPTAHIQNNIKIPSRRPNLSIKSSIKLYEWQNKALDATIQHHRGTISACTGTGKSLVIALIAARLNVNTLVVVPSREICKQLTASLLEALGPNHKVTIRNIDSTDLNTLSGFDCLIIDEAHHAAAKTYQKLNKTAWASIYYRYFLTATPFRNDDEETLLFEAIAGEVIYKLDYMEAIRKSYICKVEAFYIDLPKTKTDAFTWQEVYKELIVNNEHRNSVLYALLKNLDEANKSTLCLVKEVKHGVNIGFPNFVSGEDEESRQLIKQFNAKEINSLIGTEGILGEGVDTKPCEVVILAGLGKAKSRIMQAIGRAVRKYPGKEYAKIILIRDSSHKYCLRHFNAQKKILLDEYGVIPIRLDI